MAVELRNVAPGLGGKKWRAALSWTYSGRKTRMHRLLDERIQEQELVHVHIALYVD